MVHGVSLPNVTQFNPTDRLVHDRDGGFKPAASGSLIGRAINWVKETFFKSSVERANVAAYQAARADWKASNGHEDLQARTFFEAKLGARSVFSLAELRPLLDIPPAMTGRTETVDSAFLKTDGVLLAGVADNKADGRAEGNTTHYDVGATGIKLTEQFLKDVARATYVVEGAMVSDSGIAPDGSAHESADLQRVADRVGPSLIAAFGPYYAEAVSNCVHQTLGAPLTAMIAGMGGEDAGRLKAPDGRPLDLVSLPQGMQIFDLKRNENGSVHVDYTLGFIVEPGREGNDTRGNPLAVLADGSNGSIRISFDIVKGAEPGKFDLANMSQARYDYTIGIRRGFEDLLPPA